MNALSRIKRPHFSYAIVLVILAASGCHSSSYAQRGTTCAALGTSLDDIDARNRSDIAAQLGRPVAPGPATPEEVAAMTRAGVDPRFIICYINRSTMVRPITAQDVIYLHEQGVDAQVIQAMLTPGTAYPRSAIVRVIPPPRTVIIEDPWGPYCYPHYGLAYGYGCRCY